MSSTGKRKSQSVAGMILEEADEALVGVTIISDVA